MQAKKRFVSETPAIDKKKIKYGTPKNLPPEDNSFLNVVDINTNKCNRDYNCTHKTAALSVGKCDL